MNNYYHAGTQIAAGNVKWSESTRRTAQAAEHEAKRMAETYGGTPMVEYWDRSHGLRPSDCDAVQGAYVVA